MKMRLLILSCATVVLACGGDSTTGVDTSFLGSYTLQSINTKSLPYVVFQSGTSSVSVTSDHLTIAGDGSWSESGTTSTVTNGGAPVSGTSTDHGTWTRSGTTLSLVSALGNATSFGAWSGNTLALNDGTFASVYVK